MLLPTPKGEAYFQSPWVYPSLCPAGLREVMVLGGEGRTAARGRDADCGPGGSQSAGMPQKRQSLHQAERVVEGANWS